MHCVTSRYCGRSCKVSQRFLWRLPRQVRRRKIWMQICRCCRVPLTWMRRRSFRSVGEGKCGHEHPQLQTQHRIYRLPVMFLCIAYYISNVSLYFLLFSSFNFLFYHYIVLFSFTNGQSSITKKKEKENKEKKYLPAAR